MRIVRFSEGDMLVMKKAHPCGDNRFDVLRSGSEVRIRCLGCGRDVTVQRMKLEKNIKSVVYANRSDAVDDDSSAKGRE